MAGDETAGSFEVFVGEVGPRLKQALVAALGGELGREATSEAFVWGFEHWDRLQGMENPAGYLYRVGRSRATSMLRRRPLFPPPDRPSGGSPWVEPGLPVALASLSEMQRVCVMLIHSFGWTFREVASYLEVAVSTVQVHTERGMARLRAELKVEVDA